MGNFSASFANLNGNSTVHMEGVESFCEVNIKPNVHGHNSWDSKGVRAAGMKESVLDSP